MVEFNKGYNCDNIELLKAMADNSLHIICIDPPYLYLKGQKLERPFDERFFFAECARVLKPGGFIVMFGRGTSFYRWNTILDELGMVFKEEIIWDKSQSSSPLMNLSRVHETVAIFSKGKASINKVKVPYMEMKSHDINSVIQDVKRLSAVLNNPKSLQAVLEYLELNKEDTSLQAIRNDRVELSNFTKHQVTSDNRKGGDRACNSFQSMHLGMNEKSIIRYSEKAKENNYNTSVQPCVLKSEDRSAAVVRIMGDGMNEKSIIKQVRNHYSSIHPTEKPVRLLERLLSLVISQTGEPIYAADFFAGSFSFAEACINMGINWICCEIDEEFFSKGMERILNKQLKLIINNNEGN